MILPQLFLADLPSDAVLTPQLIRDACIAVKRNRANWLAQRRTQELVELIAFADQLKKLREGGSETKTEFEPAEMV